MKSVLASAGLIYVFVSTVSCLSFKGIEERFTCDKFTVDPSLTQKWMESVPFWYTPFWNKVDFYQNAEDFFGTEEFAKLSVDNLDKTCIYYKENGTYIPIYGFGDRVLKYESFPDPVRKGIQYWTVRNDKGDREYHATSYITKTDNKTYFFAVTVWWNGMKGFNVGSSIPKFDEKTLQEIKDHAKEIGFMPEHFVEQDYSNCPTPPTFLQNE